MCLVYAKVTEADGDFDPVQASRMSVLLPHHRDAKKLRARVNKLVDDAVTAFPVPSEMDEASGWVRALRLYAEQLGTKKTVKKKKSSDDDEDSVDDEPIVYDDREMEVDTSLGRTRLETQAERRASEVAAPAPWDDEEDVDDRWSDRRTFKGRVAEPPAPEPSSGRLKRSSDAALESEEEFDFEAPASPAAVAAPTPKTAPKRRRVVVEDEDEED